MLPVELKSGHIFVTPSGDTFLARGNVTLELMNRDDCYIDRSQKSPVPIVAVKPKDRGPNIDSRRQRG